MTNDDIGNLGTILCLGAHPDDETFMAGGLLYAATQNTQTVICVTATRGEQGIQDELRWPSGKLAEIREAELTSALKKLGVTHHEWLGYDDANCQNVSEQEAIERIKSILQKYKPDTIITFGPDGMTGHSDHKTVSMWAAGANQTDHPAIIYHSVQPAELEAEWSQADKEFNIFFNIDEPVYRNKGDCALYFELSEQCIQAKYAALAAMPSQTERLLTHFDKNYLSKLFSIEAFVKAT